MIVEWEVRVGNSDIISSFSTKISDDILSMCIDEYSRTQYINECVQDDFEQKISWYII